MELVRLKFFANAPIAALVGLEEMSYAQVAKVLNMPVGTVRSRLSRSRDQLLRPMGMDGGAGGPEKFG
jgi:RNA polymerase sigma-70 factor (ECF subfamily)